VGADYPAPGRNIRPHSRGTPAKGLSRFPDASLGGRIIRPHAGLSGLEQGDAIPMT
jgi:hypothetical protein